MLLTAFFIVLASLFSTFLAYAWILLIILYPFWLLSYPFVSYVAISLSPHYIGPYDIYLCSLKIASISREYVLFFGFLFFFSVNLLGAILGYWIDKKLTEESLKRKMLDFFIKSFFVSLVTCFPILLFSTFWFSTLWFSIAIYLFWTPAVIATAIYYPEYPERIMPARTGKLERTIKFNKKLLKESLRRKMLDSSLFCSYEKRKKQRAIKKAIKH